MKPKKHPEHGTHGVIFILCLSGNILADWYEVSENLWLIFGDILGIRISLCLQMSSQYCGKLIVDVELTIPRVKVQAALAYKRGEQYSMFCEKSWHHGHNQIHGFGTSIKDIGFCRVLMR